MQPVRIIACGALARELMAIRQLNGWSQLHVSCLPARLHNHPEQIAGAVEAALLSACTQGDERLFVAYADCGTGGALDRVLERFQVERLPGAHCYSAYAGEARFSRWQAEAPGTFYLTDFLVRHFQRLVLDELGITRHPELAAVYFGHYQRMLYLAQQQPAPDLLTQAAAAAERLGLAFEWQYTGYGALHSALIPLVEEPAWHS
ncbi:MAG: DUF1638 domain-containing protein [Saccharospirillum sp.]